MTRAKNRSFADAIAEEILSMRRHDDIERLAACQKDKTTLEESQPLLRSVSKSGR